MYLTLSIVVQNFDLPGHGKDYIHRVGETMRCLIFGKLVRRCCKRLV